MECKVCLELYNESQRRPHNLPCGHTFCSLCIDDMIKNGTLVCPRCRAKHTASDRTPFPIAYDLEEVLSKRDNSASGQGPLQSRRKDISSKINLLRDEQVTSVSNILAGFQEKKSQLERYRSKLIDWGIEHDDLIHKIQTDLIEQNEELRDNLKEEHCLVSEVLEAGESQEEELKHAEETLLTVATAQAAFVAINDAEIIQSEVENWIQKCDELFQDANPVHRSVKVRSATRKALRMVRQETEVVPHLSLGDLMLTNNHGITPTPFATPASDIVCSQNTPRLEPSSFTVDMLHQMDDNARAILQSGKVFAVCHSQCQIRCAPITLQHDRIYLHHLRKQSPPLYAYTLPYTEVEDQLDDSSVIAFLDLAWPGSAPQRIHIQLNPNNQRAAQFRILCTGKRGSSYAYTQMLEVYRKGEPGERVSGGDYDGEGGAALLRGLPWGGIYSQPASAGIVFGWGDDSIGGRFGILTRANVGNYNGVFGLVVSGLDVLRTIVNLPDISRVTVTDCGIVISQ